MIDTGEVADDGSLISPPLFTYQDSTVDISVPWWYQTTTTPLDGVHPTYKVCNGELC